MSFYPTPAEIAYLVAFELNSNQHTAAKYAGVLAGLIALFSIAHITRLVWHKAGSKGAFTRVLATPSRCAFLIERDSFLTNSGLFVELLFTR
jgi:hypothetical protein